MDYKVIVAILIVIALSFISLFGGFDRLENRLYDTLLKIKSEIPEDDRILLVDIDDTSIEKVGVWPWSRNIVADGLITMKELGSGTAVFDIEYIQKSPVAVDPDYLNSELPALFDENFEIINGNIIELFAAVAEGSLSIEDASDYILELADLNDQTRDMLLERVQHITKDNDEYFAQASRLYGDVYFTVNMQMLDEVKISESFRKWIMENIPYDDISVETENIRNL